MTRTILACCLILLAAGLAGGEVVFVAAPSAARDGSNVQITFAVSAATDVEVAVLDGQGAVVRHLAAGLLGPSAPAPLAKDSLAQTLTWDGSDDAGKPVAARGLRVRIRLGGTPQLDTMAGRNGNTFGSRIEGLACGPTGELFVLLSDSFRGRSEMRVLDRGGKYLRTILPYAADTPVERTESVGHLIVNGERLPIVFNGLGHTLSPLVNGMKTQNMAFSPAGHLVLASGIGTMAEHGPPRHLLAMHPEGGAPVGVNFVGPQLRKGRDRMIGGEGEGGTRWFDHLAVSPDGQWVYLTTWTDSRYSPRRHGVWRMRWSDQTAGPLFLGADESGADDAHFNDPAGLAVDKAGNLYVCDRGNDRVMVFAADGKPAGRFAVPAPEQIAVHPATGVIYLLSHRQPPDKRTVTPSTLIKFSAWSAAAPPRRLAETDALNVAVMALDASATPAKLWVYGGAAAGGRTTLLPVTDAGDKFEIGSSVANGEGLAYPMFLAGDPARNRVLVYEGGQVIQVDLAGGKKAPFAKGTDLCIDRAGNVYILDGYGTNSLSRYAPDGKPLPFSSAGSNKIKVTPYRGYGPSLGLQGVAVRPNGDFYVAGSSNYGGPGVYGGRINQYGPDGAVKAERIIDGMGYGDCGLGVDAAGNLYVGVNLKPADHPFPDEFVGKVPTERWTWWRAERPVPWRYTYYNSYLWHWGGVMKFGPEGGAFYGQHPFNLKRPDYSPPTKYDLLANAPAGSPSFRSAYLGWEVKVAGMKWYFQGAGIIPSSGDGLMPDPGCVCYNSHLAVDEYGRVFAPDVFRFCVQRLDAAGNSLGRIGRYGNADSVGPQIAFAWPSYVAAAGGKVYVSDPVNRRIVVVRFAHAAEAVAAVP